MMLDVWEVLRSLRDRIESLRRRAGRPAEAGGSRQGWAGRVHDGGAIPATTPAVYLVRPIELTGDRTEGSSVTFPAAGEPIPVLILGQVPVAGTPVEVVRVADWWVAQRRAAGATGGTIPTPCCPDRLLPDVLYVHTAKGRVTLTYGPTPSGWIWNDPLSSSVDSYTGCQLLEVEGTVAGCDTIVTLTTAVRYRIYCHEFDPGDGAQWFLVVATAGCQGEDGAPYGPLGDHRPIAWDCTSPSVPAVLDGEGNLIGSTGGVQTLANCILCDPFALEFPVNLGNLQTHIWGIPVGFDAKVAVTEAEAPEVSTQLCALVAECEDGSNPLPGLTVSLTKGDDPTVIATEISNEDGRVCFNVTEVGDYGLSVADGDCPSTIRAVVGTCSVPEDVILQVCCAHVCLTVSALFAEATSGTSPVSLVGTIVTATGLGSLTTDGSGQICADLTPAQMRALPQSEVGGCTSRDLEIVVRKSGFLDRCFTTPIVCGDTAATGAITLYSLKTTGGDDRYVKLPTALATVCPDLGCGTGGWSGRGVIPLRMAIQFFSIEYDFDDEGTLNTWSLRPAALASPVILFLDNDLFTGVSVPAYHSPFGTTQRVEWKTAFAGSWTSRGEGVRTTTGIEVYLGATGAYIRLKFPGYDPADPDGLGSASVPYQVPEGSEIGTVQSLDIPLLTTVNPCNFVGGTGSRIATLGDGHQFRASFAWTEAPAP